MSNPPPHQPGMWYVIYPYCARPTSPHTAGGPFATEAEARQWLAAAASLFDGGRVWQCPLPTSSPQPPPACNP
jgi:hypothetical protein